MRFLESNRTSATGKDVATEVEMPGDPKECRQHALNCVRLAQTSSTPQTREQFASLVNTWLRLAADLEQAQVFLDALDEDTEEQPIRRTG
jgi:hypothetical protein